MWRSPPIRLIGCVVAAVLSGCSQAEPTAADAGSETANLCGPYPQPLTANGAAMWVSAVACANQSDAQSIDAQIAAARGDETIVEALLALLGAWWTDDGTQQALVGDFTQVSVTIRTLGALGDPASLDPLTAFVWRTVGPNDDLMTFSVLEEETADAIGCIPTSAAAATMQQLASSHPLASVRNEATAQIANPKCGF